MPHVSLTNNGSYWRAYWTASGRQVHRSLGRKGKVSRADALDRCRALEVELSQGDTAAAPGLAAWIERYLADHPAYAEGTAYLYRHTGASLRACFSDDLAIDAISREQARAWRTGLASGGIAESTVCLHVAHAKAMFKQAHDDGLLPCNPFDRLESTPPNVDKDWQYIDLSTYHRLIEACPGAAWRLLLALCRLAGLRRNEALALEWADIDLQARKLTANASYTTRTTKKRRRQVPISPELYDLLFAAWMDGNEEQTVVGVGGASLHRTALRIMAMAGVAAFPDPFQSLRRSMERDWLDAGHDLPTVADWMGHSPAVAMKHYVRAEGSAFDKAAGVIPSGDNQKPTSANLR